LSWEIILLQHSIWEGGFSQNSQKILELLEKERLNFSSQKRFLLLPELALRGFPYSKLEKNAYSLQDSPDVKFYSQLARDYALFLSGSVIEKECENIFNTTLIFDPQGEIISTYRKIYLIKQEARYFKSGEEARIINIEGLRVGMATCYDLRFPELFRLLSLAGVKIVFVSGQFPEERIHHWRILLQARAIENQIFIAGVNRCGHSKILYYPGNSLLISPFGEILVEATEAEGIWRGEIELSQVESVRKKSFYLADIKKEIIQKLLPTLDD